MPKSADDSLSSIETPVKKVAGAKVAAVKPAADVVAATPATASTAKPAAPKRTPPAPKLTGTAAEKFAEAQSKEAEAGATAAEASKELSAAKKAFAEAKTSAAKADAAWADVEKRDAKAFEEQLKGAGNTAVKAKEAQLAYAQKLRTMNLATYAKAEGIGSSKEAAALYAEAGSVVVTLKALPALEVLDSYVAILTGAQADLDPAPITNLRKDLSSAMSDASAGEALNDQACAQAKASLKKAFAPSSSKSSPSSDVTDGSLDAARLSWNSAEAKLASSSASLKELVKVAAPIDNLQRLASASLMKVHLDEQPQFQPVAKEVSGIVAAQKALKTIGSTSAEAEKSTRQALGKLGDAKGSWGKAKQRLTEAEKTANQALSLYSDAAKLGVQEAELFSGTGL